MVKTKVVIIMVTSLLLVMSCSRMNNQQNDFDLHGAWVLKQEKTPEGYTHSYPQNGTTQCRVYVGDSVYSCNLMYTASGMAIVPLSCSDYTFIDKGNHDERGIDALCTIDHRARVKGTEQHFGLPDNYYGCHHHVYHLCGVGLSTP